MAYGRVYTITFANVSVSAVQDLLAVYAGANKAFAVHSVTIGQITASTVGNLRVSLKRLPVTVTSGSGGTAPTVNPRISTDTAATITARANDTTQATTSGTAQIMIADVFNVINGFMFLPPADDRIIVGPNQAFIVSLDTAPGSAETMSGAIVVEELF